MSLTDTQRFMLASRAGGWALDAQRRAQWPADRGVDFEAAHFVALSLAHLGRCLVLLKGTSPALDEATSVFCKAMTAANLRDARNALEHEEDYLAGLGRKDKVPGDCDTWPVCGTEGSWSTTLMGTDRLEQIRVLGRSYSFGAALDAIPSLHEALSSWLTGFRGW